jgi:hypothetical protein
VCARRPSLADSPLGHPPSARGRLDLDEQQLKSLVDLITEQ